MAKDTVQKSVKPSKTMYVRTILVYVAVVIVLVYVIFVLGYNMLIKGETYANMAVNQQLDDSIVAAHRGTIYDCNKNVLAESQQVWTIIMSAKAIAGLPDDQVESARKTIAKGLSEMFKLDYDSVYEDTGFFESEYQKVIGNLENPQVEKFQDWAKKNDLSGTGIFRIISDYKRTYPYGSLASTVIGFTGTDHYGLYGLEAKYDETLTGVAGRVVSIKNSAGDEMAVSLACEKTIDAEDGNSLVLTIDENIQRIAEKYLAQSISENDVANRGVSIVMDVKTGAILAMAVKGDFDLTDPWKITNPTVKQKLDLLSGDKYSDALAAARMEQWSNKAVSEFYEPGSVFKIFTSCMSLEEGVADTDTTTFYCPGYKEVNGQTIVCWHPPGHGTQHFADIISNSCNPGFITLGLSLGGERFYKYFVGFGFTEPTGIDTLSEAISNSGLYHGIDMTDLDVATSSMGQTFKITPIQMITAISAVANGGYLLQPYLVSEILDENGNIVSKTEPTVKRQVVSSETCEKVTEMLAAAVNGGGSKNVYVPGYRVAGKSGTSDKTESRKEGYLVWGSFGTFAPADDPRIACLTIIDEPHSSNRYGSHVAGPVCQGILEESLPYLGVEPIYTEAEMANLSTTTPNVMDKEISTASTIIGNADLQIQVLGNGATVLDQVPTAGSTIPKSGTVYVYTDDDSLGSTATVPNFDGMTLSQAQVAADNAGINISVTGNISTGGATAYNQNWQPGARLPKGSVVTLRFETTDAIA